MGTAPSALYRYFPSQSDLVTALCIEAYDSLAAALAAARDAQPPGDHAGRWLAVCQAYRRWSLDHPADFALIFGTPLPGYHAPQEVTAAAAGRSAGIAADVFAAAVRAGAADPGRAQIPASLNTGALWAALAGENTLAREPALAAIFLTAWASLLGYLVAEIFGSLTQLISDTDTLYQAHVRTVMLGMGFRPSPHRASRPSRGLTAPGPAWARRHRRRYQPASTGARHQAAHPQGAIRPGSPAFTTALPPLESVPIHVPRSRRPRGCDHGALPPRREARQGRDRGLR